MVVYIASIYKGNYCMNTKRRVNTKCERFDQQIKSLTNSLSKSFSEIIKIGFGIFVLVGKI